MPEGISLSSLYRLGGPGADPHRGGSWRDDKGSTAPSNCLADVRDPNGCHLKGSMGRARQVPVSTLRYAWEITQTYLGNTYIILYIYIHRYHRLFQVDWGASVSTWWICYASWADSRQLNIHMPKMNRELLSVLGGSVHLDAFSWLEIGDITHLVTSAKARLLDLLTSWLNIY